jgi:hypothetical protein
MNLQALGDSSDSELSNFDTNSSGKENISNENSVERIDVDQEAANENISVKV